MPGPTATYDSNKVLVICGGAIMSGFADGTKVTVAFAEDAWTLQVGTDGENVRSKSNNLSGTIEIQLLQSSTSNDVLSAFALADKLGNAGVFPVLVKDAGGTTLYSAEKAWVKKMPDSEFAREAGSRVWVIETGNLTAFVGGIAA